MPLKQAYPPRGAELASEKHTVVDWRICLFLARARLHERPEGRGGRRGHYVGEKGRESAASRVASRLGKPAGPSTSPSLELKIKADRGKAGGQRHGGASRWHTTRLAGGATRPAPKPRVCRVAPGRAPPHRRLAASPQPQRSMHGSVASVRGAAAAPRRGRGERGSGRSGTGAAASHKCRRPPRSASSAARARPPLAFPPPPVRKPSSRPPGGAYARAYAAATRSCSNPWPKAGEGGSLAGAPSQGESGHRVSRAFLSRGRVMGACTGQPAHSMMRRRQRRPLFRGPLREPPSARTHHHRPSGAVCTRRPGGQREGLKGAEARRAASRGRRLGPPGRPRVVR